MPWVHATGLQSLGSKHCSVSSMTALVVTAITMRLLARKTVSGMHKLIASSFVDFQFSLPTLKSSCYIQSRSERAELLVTDGTQHRD